MLVGCGGRRNPPTFHCATAMPLIPVDASSAVVAADPLAQFLTSPRDALLLMLSVVRNGGLGAGGINFDAKVRLFSPLNPKLPTFRSLFHSRSPH